MSVLKWERSERACRQGKQGEKELETRGDEMQSNGPNAGRVGQFTATAGAFFNADSGA